MNRRLFLTSLAGALALTVLPSSAAPALPGRIIIVENLASDRVLFSVDPTSGKVTRLTHEKGQEDSPCISPDGRTVIFAGFRGSGDWNVYTLDLASGKVSRLVDRPSWPICWLPDGRIISSLDSAIWVLDARGKPLKKIADPQGSPISGSVTPQGELIYHDVDEPSHVRAVNVITGAARKMMVGYDPAVSVDGQWMVFSNRGKYFRAPVNGGAPVPLKLPKGASGLRFAPDGKYLAWINDTRLVIATADFKVVKTIPVGASINTITWGP